MRPAGRMFQECLYESGFIRALLVWTLNWNPGNNKNLKGEDSNFHIAVQFTVTYLFIYILIDNDLITQVLSIAEAFSEKKKTETGYPPFLYTKVYPLFLYTKCKNLFFFCDYSTFQALAHYNVSMCLLWRNLKSCEAGILFIAKNSWMSK